MDFDPTEVRKDFKGVGYPSNKEDLASTTERNDAPNDPVERFLSPPEGEYTDPDGAQEALKKS
jgi:hypothetical protein